MLILKHISDLLAAPRTIDFKTNFFIIPKFYLMKSTIKYALIVLLPLLLMSYANTLILNGVINLNFLENYSNQTIPK